MKTPVAIATIALAAAAFTQGCASGGHAGSAAAAPGAPGSRPASPAESRAIFEKFKSIEGDWTGTSTKGWTERISYKVIANGSAVLESSFDAHPGEQMLTLIHPDGDRLMLTHYCAAKNQPRLVLTQVKDNGNTAVFEFLDATNLPSRDKGHMDKVVFTFKDANTFTDQWTWYEKGKESWMEEIVNTRAK